MPDYEDMILARQELIEIWEDEPDIDPKYYGGSCVVVPACLLEEEVEWIEYIPT